MTNEQNLARQGSPQSATPTEPSLEKSRLSQRTPGAPADQSQHRVIFEGLVEDVNYSPRTGTSHSGSL